MSLLIKERDYLRSRLDLLEDKALRDELAAHPSWPLAQDHLRPFDGENWGYARDWLSELEIFQACGACRGLPPASQGGENESARGGARLVLRGG